MSSQPLRLRKPVKWLLGGLAAFALLIAVLVAAFGFIVGRVPQYRVQLQDWIEQRSGLAVEFRALSARLRLYGPELVFDAAVVRTPDRTRVLATARRGSVGLDLWGSIRTGRLTAGRFALESPEIALIRTREGRIQLLGQSALPERSDAKPFALEQLPTGRFHVRNAVVSFRDQITGRGPWSLSGVSFELTRDTDSMQLQGDASLPQALGRELTFGATAEGPLEQAATLVATFRIEGRELDLAGWADVLPDAWPVPETGRGSLRIHGALTGSALTQLSANVNFASITAVPPAWATPLPLAQPLRPPGESGRPEPPPAAPPDGAAEPQPAPPQMLSYARIAFGLRADKRADTWNVALSDLQLDRPESSWSAKHIETSWSHTAQGGLALRGKADRVALASLWPLLTYLPESAAVARIRALDAAGTIEDLSFEYRRAAAQAAAQYSVQARLQDLSFAPIERTPGLAGLGGALRFTEQGGQWQIAGSDVKFELPRMFRAALAAKSVDGTVSWQRADSGWTIGSEQLRLQGEDGRAVARFAATIPRDGSSPTLDLSAQGEDLEVSATRKYIPAGKLGRRTLEWFDRAFVAGRVSRAQLRYSGPTRSFPFRNGEGTFLVRGHVDDALFDYRPEWLPAQGVSADVEFRNQGMHVHASAARVGNLQVSDATAQIADLKQAHLKIQARAHGELADGLQFLKRSPLADKLGEAFARLEGRGAINASVRLDLPIRRLAERKVEVTTRFDDATVWMQKVSAPVKALSGTLTVRDTLVAAARLKGQWLGGPLDVSVRPDGARAAVLDVHGHASATQLKTLLSVPANIEVSGATDWHLSTRLGASRTAAAADRAVRIESLLEGLAIGLPEPLGKSAAEARPLQLTLEVEGDRALLARGSLGDVRALLQLRRSNDAWSLDRGGVRADGVVPALPNHRGLRIEGTVARFVLDDWLALRESGSGGTRLADVLHAANVRVGSFELAGYRWPDVRGILQSTQAGWRIDVSGPNAAGQVLLPESFSGAQPLRATLERLVLERAPAGAVRADTARDPRNLPSLQVHVGELQLGARRIGTFDLKATRLPEGIRFDSISVNGGAARAEGHGEWLLTAQGPRSALSATLRSDDVAATLRALNYGEFITAKLGEVRGDLKWPGGFGGNILEHASGALSVRAEAGQLAAVQPGAGRVLGLFSVAALPRRLALDFSDLTDKGLAFDTIQGDFGLRDGNAYTNNLLLRGPAAEIGIAGRTGLATRDYDQTAVVTGNLGVSLPVAGTLAGGPAVGAALLLFSQVFKEPLKGITRGYYRITGPWDEPSVERVDAQAIKVSEQVTGDRQ